MHHFFFLAPSRCMTRTGRDIADFCEDGLRFCGRLLGTSLVAFDFGIV